MEFRLIKIIFVACFNKFEVVEMLVWGISKILFIKRYNIYLHLYNSHVISFFEHFVGVKQMFFANSKEKLPQKFYF